MGSFQAKKWAVFKRKKHWSNTQNIPYYVKSGVSYNNDPSDGSLSNNDEKSIEAWFGIGKKHVNLFEDGTDRLFTNDKDVWTSRAWKGDRWDPWNIGYNEIFSPYSSPSTKAWNNSGSGIFIWNYFASGSSVSPPNIAYFKIYRTGAGEPLSLDSVLHLTPPSRPMGLRVLPCDSLPVTGGYKRIKIRWVHNLEPDMIRIVSQDTLKTYKIYRSISEDMSVLPPDALAFSENYYVNIATIDIGKNASPSYTDTLTSICTVPPVYGEPWVTYPVRYRVRAVDKYNDVSVLSDFANTEAWKTSNYGGGGEEDNIVIENNIIPKEFALKQNFPNPFNPITNIQYDLPLDNFVTIKIYDLLGKEILTLVNDFKNAGSYIISLNGSNLSSGIYYYKIKASNPSTGSGQSFEQVKKMILLK